MPWSKKENSQDCPPEKPWAVVNDDTDEVEGCHADEESADAQIAALHANTDEEDTPTPKPEDKSKGNRFAVLTEQMVKPGAVDVAEDENDNSFTIPVMVIEGVWTGDRRFIDPGVLTWRDLPLPVMAITKTTQGHDDAELCGKLTVIERKDAGEAGLIDARTQEPYAEGTTYLRAEGEFDSSEWSNRIRELVANEFLRGNSVDMGDVTSDIVFTDEDGNEQEGVDFFEWLFGEAEMDPGLEMGEKIREGRIMGTTICPFPAFEGAYVEVPAPLAASGVVATPQNLVNDGRWPSIIMRDKPFSRNTPGLVAAAAPVTPPAEWFSNPKFEGKCPLTIEPSGRVYGHLATWDECHTAFNGQCIKAPRSAADYAHYRTGAVLTSDEILIPTGRITMGTGHAELWMDATAAKAHYDNTGTAVMDVATGEDAYGIWFAGALLPDVDEIAIRRLRGSALSGDWRTRGGNLELVAVLAVNTAGFPVTRPVVRVASGWPQAMVAAGMLSETTIIKETKSTGHRVVDEKFKDRVVRESLRNRVHNV
jgi:hypothetical protein